MKVCNGTTKAHQDATKIVEYLQSHDGFTRGNNDEITRDIGFYTNPAKGIFHLNRARFHAARNHLMDYVDQDGKPCCAAYRVNYRKSGRGGSELRLIEQKENDLDQAALAELVGVTSRLHQQQTEISRMDRQFEALRIWCWHEKDREGYDILGKMQDGLNTSGTIRDDLLIHFGLWAEARSS